MLWQGLLLEGFTDIHSPRPGLILLAMHGDDSLGAFVIRKYTEPDLHLECSRLSRKT